MATCMERHRHQECLKFPASHRSPNARDKQLHLIVDNYATHQHPAVLRWAVRHSAFISTSRPPAAVGSTCRTIFRDLTENQLRRGVFTSVEALPIERILA